MRKVLLQVLEAAGPVRVTVILLLLWQRSVPGLDMVVMVLRNQHERCEYVHTPSWWREAPLP